jgi:hypothetical protein
LLPHLEDTAQSRYGEVFSQLDLQGLRRIRTIDSGVANDDNLVDYTPQLWFYTLAWRERGLDISADNPNQPAAIGAGEVLVTCDPRHLGEVRGLGPSRARVAISWRVSPRPNGKPRAGKGKTR